MDIKNELNQKITHKTARIGIIGMGYVGLPLALAFTDKGFTVTGFDIDQSKVDQLSSGASYFKHISSERVNAAVTENLLNATTDFSKITNMDAVIICLPTPLNAHREPDLSYIEENATEIAKYLQKGQLIALESTTYPGTSEEILKPILETSGLTAGKDFYLVYSPEREDPNNPEFHTSTIPKVVAGLTPLCCELAEALYGAIINKTVPVSSLRAAEATKLLENIYRSINIAMVNELKTLFHRMDIDIFEVIEAASTKPFGYTPFYPGPGLGGHCIPIDPFYLTWKAREFELPTRFIELAGQINTNMPEYVIQRLESGLNSRKKCVNGSKIALLGIAYKKNVDDIRESPALKLIEILQKKGAIVSYHDPFIPKIPKMRAYSISMASEKLTEDYLESQDCVLIATDHSCIDMAFILKHSAFVLDTRNATKEFYTQFKEKILKA